MKVLVGCEFSGIVRDAFIAHGHDAMSCDILPTEKPGPHYQGDVMDILDDGWDLMIAHPPCTFLCRNGANHQTTEEYKQMIADGKKLFMGMLNAPIERICVENPVPRKMAQLPPYTQIIQPYHYGHDHSKKTCLWLKNLPELQPTKMVDITYITTANGHRYTAGWYKTPRNSKDRSRTFQGIADAMADQWGSGTTNQMAMDI